MKTITVEVPESLEEALASGSFRYEDAEVSADVNGTKVKRPYQKKVALTLGGAIFLVGGQTDLVVDENGKAVRGKPSVCADFTYGNDLGVKAAERNILVAATEGPEKAIEKAAKALMALGVPADKAREAAIALHASAQPEPATE